MAKFQEHEVVRVICIPERYRVPRDPRFRVPRVGDRGTIVATGLSTEVEAYTVECVAPDGGAEWLLDFLAEELERA